jgi:hypothetical protein
VAVVIEGTTAVPEGATQRIDPADVVPSPGAVARRRGHVRHGGTIAMGADHA